MKLSIGQVAKLFDISIDTLRHYDKIEILKPEVNKDNGYRYYSFQHLDQLALILGTKYLGISLSDIKNTIESEDIKEYKNLIFRQEEMINQKIEHLNKLAKEIEENKQMLNTIINFKNEYDFSKLQIQKNKYNFYCIDYKNLLSGNFYKEYLDLLNEDLEEYFYIYDILENKILKENEKFLCIRKKEQNSIFMENTIKLNKLDIVKKNIYGSVVVTNFYGNTDEIENYLKLLIKYFRCEETKEIFIKYDFYLPKKKEKEKYFIEIILKIK